MSDVGKLFDGFAERYWNQHSEETRYLSSLDQFIVHVDEKNASVLELGCGPGNVSRYLLERRPKWKLIGLDISEKMIELAMTNVPEAKFVCRDVKDLTGINQKFDGIIGAFCLPYLRISELEKLLPELKSRLKKRGILYLSTMEADESQSGFRSSSTGEGPQIYLQYYQEELLRLMLFKAGFSILHFEKFEYENKGEAICDMVLIATSSKNTYKHI